MEIAADEGSGVNSQLSYQVSSWLGLEVEMRPIHINEVSSFQEVAACGTAVGRILTILYTILI